MNLISKFLVISIAIFSTATFAQTESVVDRDYSQIARGGSQLARGGNVAMLEINQKDISGIQFEFRYDKNVSVSSIENCLAGIPETHKGSFTTCKHFPEKNTILVVVSDIGGSRALTGPIGWIEFKGGSKGSTSPFQLAEIVALDTSGATLSDASNSIRFSVE